MSEERAGRFSGAKFVRRGLLTKRVGRRFRNRMEKRMKSFKKYYKYHFNPQFHLPKPSNIDLLSQFESNLCVSLSRHVTHSCLLLSLVDVILIEQRLIVICKL